MDLVQGAKAGLSVTQTVVTGVITLVVASQINKYVTSHLQKENA